MMGPSRGQKESALLFTNGQIYQMDAAASVVDTLVVRGGRVVFAGRRGDVNPRAGEETVDLGGRAVLPGLVDGHAHLMHLARTRLSLDAGGLRSEEDVARLVGAAARRAAPGVLPSMQPTHCTSDMAWAPDRLGPERLRGAYAWRSLLDTGVIIAGGSDFPVADANPFHGIHAAVTRRPRTGEDPGWPHDQRMTRQEAVCSFTTWNARAAFQEHELGSLEPGQRADLIVLSEDVFACPEDRIKDIAPS